MTTYIYRGQEISHTRFISILRAAGINGGRKLSYLEVLTREVEKGNQKAIEILNNLEVIEQEKKTLFFDSLNEDFRRAFKKASKNGLVKFTVEGIKDCPESIYPIFEVTNNHVTYYSPEIGDNVCVTDKKIKAAIYC